jgi:hypothetical protein
LDSGACAFRGRVTAVVFRTVVAVIATGADVYCPGGLRFRNITNEAAVGGGLFQIRNTASIDIATGACGGANIIVHIAGLAFAAGGYPVNACITARIAHFQPIAVHFVIAGTLRTGTEPALTAVVNGTEKRIIA